MTQYCVLLIAAFARSFEHQSFSILLASKSSKEHLQIRFINSSLSVCFKIQSPATPAQPTNGAPAAPISTSCPRQRCTLFPTCGSCWLTLCSGTVLTRGVEWKFTIFAPGWSGSKFTSTRYAFSNFKRSGWKWKFLLFYSNCLIFNSVTNFRYAVHVTLEVFQFGSPSRAALLGGDLGERKTPPRFGLYLSDTVDYKGERSFRVFLFFLFFFLSFRSRYHYLGA